MWLGPGVSRGRAEGPRCRSAEAVPRCVAGSSPPLILFKGQSHGNNLDSVTVLNILKNDLSTPQVLFCKVLHLSVSMGLEISFSIFP